MQFKFRRHVTFCSATCKCPLASFVRRSHMDTTVSHFYDVYPQLISNSTKMYVFAELGTFLIDWTNLDRQELGMDGLGSWGKPSGRTRFYKMDTQKSEPHLVIFWLDPYVISLWLILRVWFFLATTLKISIADKFVTVSDSRGQLPKGMDYDGKCQLRKYEHPTTTLIGEGANRFIKKV